PGRNTSKITPVTHLSGGCSPSYTTPRDGPHTGRLEQPSTVAENVWSFLEGEVFERMLQPDQVVTTEFSLVSRRKIADVLTLVLLSDRRIVGVLGKGVDILKAILEVPAAPDVKPAGTPIVNQLCA